MSEVWRDPARVVEYLSREIPHRDIAEAMLLQALPLDVGCFIDLGTGNGRLIDLLRQHYPDAQALGIDFSEPMLAQAGERFADEPLVELQRHDLAQPLEAPAVVDAVVSALAIHHLEDARKQTLFSEIHALLRPGGVFVNLDLVAAASAEQHERFRLAIGRPQDDPADRLASLCEQLAWLRAAGFEDVDCQFKWLALALFVGTKRPARDRELWLRIASERQECLEDPHATIDFSDDPMNVSADAPPAKRRYRMAARAQAAAATRERVLATAWEHFASHPYDEVPLRQIAAAAHVSPQTLHNLFQSKEELFTAAFLWWGAGEITERQAAPIGQVQEAIRVLFDRYENHGPAILRLLSQEERIPAVRRMTDAGRAYHRHWVQTTFAPLAHELKGAARQRRLAALVAATDLLVWKLLRHDMKLDRPTAELVMAELAGDDKRTVPRTVRER